MPHVAGHEDQLDHIAQLPSTAKRNYFINIVLFNVETYLDKLYLYYKLLYWLHHQYNQCLRQDIAVFDIDNRYHTKLSKHQN